MSHKRKRNEIESDEDETINEIDTEPMKKRVKQSNTTTKANIPINNTGLDTLDNAEKGLKQLINQLINKKPFNIFLNRMNWSQFNCPQKNKIIVNDICLSDISNKVINNEYSDFTIYEVGKDIRQIYQNMYNMLQITKTPPSHHFYVTTNKFRKFFEKSHHLYFKKYCKNDKKVKLVAILNKVLQNNDCIPFVGPVNETAYNLNDYYDKIKNPMDIGTVMYNMHNTPILQSMEYTMTIWNNATKYNSKGTEINESAHRQWSFCNNLFYQELPKVKYLLKIISSISF